MRNQTNQSYRPEINGIRALAVIAVVVNHSTNNILTSGFLGVDIFFVISGYVITSSITNYKSSTLLGFLKEFYSRRCRRILPALGVYVGVIGTLIAFFAPEPKQYLLTGISSLLGSSNLYLYRQSTDYFSSSANLNPFLNTWSLGIEEQFYLLAPIALWYAIGKPKNQPERIKPNQLIKGIILLTVLSYITFILLFNKNNPAFYYLPVPRIWELSLGVLAYVYFKGKQLNSIFKPIYGLIILVICLSLPISLQALSTTLVVLSTAYIIITVTQKDMVYKLLTKQILVKTGKVSYSLYLWHWGILSILTWTIGLNIYSNIIMIIATILITLLSYKYIETPFRGKSEGAQNTVNSVVVSTTAVGLLIAYMFPLKQFIFRGERPKLIDNGVESLTKEYTLKGTNGAWKGRDCILESNMDTNKVINIDRCTLGNYISAKRRILVIGNSYSAAFIGAFEPLVEKNNYAITLTSSWGASPLKDMKNTGNWSKANYYYWKNVVPNLIEQLKPNDWVFLISELYDYKPKTEHIQNIKELDKAIKKFSLNIKEKSLKLAILGSMPLVRDAKCDPNQAIQQWFNPYGVKCNFHSKEYTLEKLQYLNKVLKANALKHNITLVEVFEIFCPGKECTYADKKGNMLYRDEFSHPSREAAMRSSKIFQTQLTK